MKLLVIDIKEGEITVRDNATIGDILPDGSAFDQFSNDVLNGLEYTWKDIGDVAWNDI